MLKRYPIKPVPKPRMTRRDSRSPGKDYRPSVKRYWEFCDRIERAGIELPESGTIVVFELEMPKSWSFEFKASRFLTSHRVKPDLSNLLKALEDACLEEDSVISDYRSIAKVWSNTSGIIVSDGFIEGRKYDDYKDILKFVKGDSYLDYC